MSDVRALLARARDWMADDPDPLTRAELGRLLQAATSPGDSGAALAELADRFSGPLEFGTAGLRGPLGAGQSRMNRATVIRTAAGLGGYLREHGGDSVVVGFDARHGSDVFARDTCAVLTAAGLSAMVLPRPLPTPVLAFAIRHLGADAGVMVTASHNPPQDNGYKVYLCDGSQIVPPADAEISAHIEAVGPVRQVRRAEDGWHTLGDADVLEPYLHRVVSLLPPGPRDLRLVYTPMHGVGGQVVHDALVAAGFPRPGVVPAQAMPDPDFPTVAFPNPEEPGALDLAFAAAREAAADLVIANDPDADRCALAIPDPAVPSGWRMLRGDEVGVLLGWHLVTRGLPAGSVLATSIVSSTLLGKIAAAHGLGSARTLTGFKWIGRVPGLAYGYEEALGYCVDPAAVADKDGVSAALLAAELAAGLKAAGRGLTDVLDELARTYGVHATDQLSVRVPDRALIWAALDRLRGTPPASLGGRGVQRVEDLAAGVDGLPPTSGLRLTLSGDAWVVVRPSGTEPKLKCYLEVVEPLGPVSGPVSSTDTARDERLATARAAADATLRAMRLELAGVLGLG